MFNGRFRSDREKTRKTEISRDFSVFFDPNFFRISIDPFSIFFRVEGFEQPKTHFFQNFITNESNTKDSNPRIAKIDLLKQKKKPRQQNVANPIRFQLPTNWNLWLQNKYLIRVPKFFCQFAFLKSKFSVQCPWCNPFFIIFTKR